MWLRNETEWFEKEIIEVRQGQCSCDVMNEVTRGGAHIIGANAATEDSASHDGALSPDGEAVVHREDEGSAGRAGGNKHMLRENLKPKQKKKIT